jgi:hypothetical protein
VVFSPAQPAKLFPNAAVVRGQLEGEYEAFGMLVALHLRRNFDLPAGISSATLRCTLCLGRVHATVRCLDVCGHPCQHAAAIILMRQWTCVPGCQYEAAGVCCRLGMASAGTICDRNQGLYLARRTLCGLPLSLEDMKDFDTARYKVLRDCSDLAAAGRFGDIPEQLELLNALELLAGTLPPGFAITDAES